MRIGVFTVLFQNLPFEEMLDRVASHGLTAVEIATGSRPVRLPFVSAQDRPLTGMDLLAVIYSTDTLVLEALPRREKPSGDERIARQR